MSEHAEHAEHEVNYIKVWAILLCLLVVSILGPFVGIKIVTLITAFGIAIVKAYMVAKNFMHLNIEPRYAVYLLLTMLVFMLLLFAGSAPDVMKHEGRNWVKPAVHAEAQVPAHH
jgi:caa(3)-type oxidase subunit IV